MNKALLAALLFLVGTANAQVVQQWVNVYDNFNDTDRVRDMVVDRNGNVYVTGSSWGNSIEQENFVTIKYNTQGSELWRREYNNNNGPDVARAIALDSSGNVYVTGSSYNGSIDQLDYVTIKYDSAGNQQWLVDYDNSSGDDIPYAIAVDPSGIVWITGTSYDGGGDQNDIVTICYSASGTQQWIRDYDNTFGDDTAFAIAEDQVGNVYITGSSYGGPVDLQNLTTIKYSPSGTQLWIAEYDNFNGNDKGEGIVVDSAGAVFLTGTTWDGSVDKEDYVTIKYSTAGVQMWMAEYDNYDETDLAHAITLDRFGNVYVTGQSYDNPTDQFDYTTIKYSAAGMQLWVRDYDNFNGEDIAWDIACDSNASVYITGQSYDGIELENIVTISYTTTGVQQWLQSYDNFNRFDGAIAIQLDQQGGVYVAGASERSIEELNYVTIKYFVPAPCAPVIVTVAQDTFYLCNGGNDSVQLNASGGVSCLWTPATGLSDPGSFSTNAAPVTTTNYTITVYDSSGCPGTASALVIVLPSLLHTEHKWICQGSTYMFPDSTLQDTAGTHWSYFSTIHGCDSTIITVLHVDSMPPDTSVTISGPLMTANDTGAYMYMWIDCNNGGQFIPGEYNQSYLAPANGNYAVIVINYPGCRDTSSCINITSVDISVPQYNSQEVSVYPNPTDGSFTIDFGALIPKSEILITDASGRMIFVTTANNQRTSNIDVDLSPGVYLITVKSESNTSFQKLIVE